MLDYFVECMKNWNKTKGKMDRHSYWCGLLTILIFLCVLIWFGTKLPILNILPKIFIMVMIIPYITATIRRLHDVRRNVLFMLLMLLPGIGWLCLFVELIQNSKSEKDIKNPRKLKRDKIPLLNSRL